MVLSLPKLLRVEVGFVSPGETLHAPRWWPRNSRFTVTYQLEKLRDYNISRADMAI
jgi:hypothetical protein